LTQIKKDLSEKQLRSGMAKNNKKITKELVKEWSPKIEEIKQNQFSVDQANRIRAKFNYALYTECHAKSFENSGNSGVNYLLQAQQLRNSAEITKLEFDLNLALETARSNYDKTQKSTWAEILAVCTTVLAILATVRNKFK
jgi:hypothetical protein